MTATVFVGTSLDGFIAGSEGDLEWLTKFAVADVNTGYEEFIKDIDAVVMGRGTFQTVLSFPTWPYEQNVFVLSSSMKRLPEEVEGKATLLSMRPKELLAYLSGNGLSRIYVDGGKVIQDFLENDCVDELIIARVPVLLGNGIPLFGVMRTPLQFKHIRTVAYPNGLIRSYYERRRS